MLIYLIRALFLLVVAGIAARLSRSVGENVNPWGFFLIVMGLSLASVIWDVLTSRKKIQ
ncbi:MAG: hypothetical protein RJA81_2295, partial [Planctomycetota bacterium]